MTLIVICVCTTIVLPALYALVGFFDWKLTRDVGAFGPAGMVLAVCLMIDAFIAATALYQ